jgi:hypothetical protein
MMDPEQVRARAESFFKKREHERPEAARAREEYEAGQRAMREKTARLRALRLAREQERRGE